MQLRGYGIGWCRNNIFRRVNTRVVILNSYSRNSDIYYPYYIQMLLHKYKAYITDAQCHPVQLWWHQWSIFDNLLRSAKHSCIPVPSICHLFADETRNWQNYHSRDIELLNDSLPTGQNCRHFADGIQCIIKWYHRARQWNEFRITHVLG